MALPNANDGDGASETPETARAVELLSEEEPLQATPPQGSQLRSAAPEAFEESVRIDIAYPIETVSADELMADTRPSRTRKWTRIESVLISNFKAISETIVPLGDVTILVGPNGSGKSSVLQAIHWAVRAASYIVPKNGKEMMAFDRIDYLPSSEPLKTAHLGELKSETKTTPTSVIIHHIDTVTGDRSAARIRIWAARNKGGISAHIDGGDASTPYKQRGTFITSYIPGLAGLSEKETILAQPLLRRQAASGDAGGVLRNILFNLSLDLTSDAEKGGGNRRLTRLNELIGEVHPGFVLSVMFDDREDYYINASYTDASSGQEGRSLETAATGVLQVVQIFAYLVLFQPKLLLIDEPDAHLHPDKQERLIEALERAAPEFGTQIVLTTHSPHIARAAGPSARLVWMQDGAVKTDDDSAIRRLLGWGGLDKEVLFFVEDEDDKPVRAIMKQWPELARKVSICRCFGVDNLPKDKLLRGLLVDGQLGVKAVLHRDADFMTATEVDKWKTLYKTDGTFPWVTQGCDVETYFCTSNYISALYGISPNEANEWRNEASSNISKSKDVFWAKRREVNWIVYGADGGSPASEELWKAGGEKGPTHEVGKKLHAALKAVASSRGHDAKRLDRYEIPDGHEVAPDLRAILEQAVAADRNATASTPGSVFD